MRANRPPAALTATIVLLATLAVLSVFGVLVMIDSRVGILVCGGLIGICLLVVWGVRGV